MTMLDYVLRSQRALKYSISLVLLLIGLDKVFRTDLIHDWEAYVSPLAQSVLPVSPSLIVLTLGIAEVLVAVLMATKWTKLAAYISAVVLALTTVDLLSLGLYDIAARDALLIVGVLVLAWLTDAIRVTRRA